MFSKLKGIFIEADSSSTDDALIEELHRLKAGTNSTATQNPPDQETTTESVPEMDFAELTTKQDVSFGDIYKQASVPEVNFPIERLIKTVGELKSMTDTMRQNVINAMDAADDSWTIGDVLIDGQRKIQALEDFKVARKHDTNALIQEIKTKVDDQMTVTSNLVDELKLQIEGLQNQIHETVDSLDKFVENSNSIIESHQASLVSEETRLDEQIQILTKFVKQYSSPEAESNPTASSINM